MELEFQLITTQYLRRSLCQTQYQEETAESVLPESFPDIDRVLMGSAVVSIRGKELSGASVTVSGGVHADILYAAQEGSDVLHLEVYLPFSLKTDPSELGGNAILRAVPWVRSVDARATGSRRIVTRVNIGCLVEAYEPAEITCFDPQDAPEDLQLRLAEYPASVAVDAGEKQFRISEELELPPGSGLGDAVYSYTPRLEITERRLAGNKAAFKGVAHLHVLYADETGKPIGFDAHFPFSQYCELGDLYEGEELQVMPVVAGCEVSRLTRAAGDTLGMEMEITAQCLVSRQIRIPVCEDAYALHGELTPTWSEIALESRLDRREQTRVVRERQAADVREPAELLVMPDQPELRRNGETAELVIPCTASLLYFDAAGKPQGLTLHTRSAEPFSLSERALFHALPIPVADAAASVTSDGVEVRYSLSAVTECSAPLCYRTLRAAEIAQEQPQERRRSAVIARRLREGETLWELAKANRTTVERIRRANGLESDAVPAASMLLIPI